VTRRQEPTDDAVRARVEGRMKTASKTVWSLECGGLRLRCLRADGGFIVQVHDGSRWGELTKGSDAHKLLVDVASSNSVAAFLGRTPG
jgi:hypothetical protein